MIEVVWLTGQEKKTHNSIWRREKLRKHSFHVLELIN